MDNFDLKKYLAESRLLKEGIPQGSEIADYVEGMFNSSVVEKEGFQSDIWRKEQYASNDYREGSVFLDLVDHLKSVGGKDVLEGNPDIHLELLSNDDIQWSADVTLDENLAEDKLYEQKSPKFKIGDFVQPIEGATSYLLDEPRGTISSKYVGQIGDNYINKPENLEIKDGEYLYSVDQLNYRGRNAMSFDFKESDLESISDPTEYIKSLTPYKKRN